MIVTLQIREGRYYLDRLARTYSYPIYAVAEKSSEGKLNCPVIDFFHEQEGRLEKLTALLEHTARFGPPINREKFKLVEDNIFEFKSFQHRLLCFRDVGNLIVCTNGLIKKSDSLPKADIEISKQWRAAYLTAKLNRSLKHEPEHP